MAISVGVAPDLTLVHVFYLQSLDQTGSEYAGTLASWHKCTDPRHRFDIDSVLTGFECD